MKGNGAFLKQNNCDARKSCRLLGMDLFNADESYDANFLAEAIASHDYGENLLNANELHNANLIAEVFAGHRYGENLLLFIYYCCEFFF